MTAIDISENITVDKLKEHIESILSKTERTTIKTNQLEKIINFKDVLFHVWKILSKQVIMIDDRNDIQMLNLLDLLEKISIPKSFDEEGKITVGKEELIGIVKGKEYTIDVLSLKKLVRKVWQSIINGEFNPNIHRKLLLVLIELYLSRIQNPIFFTDFFMSSMNVKGVIGILALQGVAMLMQKHNIEYPNVFGKLYTMFEPSIFHTKYKSRLFYLANLFLSSTHLPEVIVASFAKRAARLSLTCTAPDIIIILRFVGNLLLRHGGLKNMIHHPTEREVAEDPFLPDENDPTKTKANESSLWEISLLSNHCQPSVSAAAKFINFNLPSLEFDLNEVLSNTYQDLFKEECNKKKQKVSLTFERPRETVAKLKDDRLFKMWTLTN